MERPKDLQWSMEVHQTETGRLLSSEEEENFYSNIQKDIMTSNIAIIVFYIGLFVRRIISPTNFFRYEKISNWFAQDVFKLLIVLHPSNRSWKKAIRFS